MHIVLTVCTPPLFKCKRNFCIPMQIFHVKDLHTAFTQMYPNCTLDVYIHVPSKVKTIKQL